MTIYQMSCFLTLSELLNFTRAAEVLNMTQPALSKIIGNIEEEVGAPLIVRTKRNVSMTDAGINLCNCFRQIIQIYNSGIESSVDIAQGMSGTVRIGFSSAMAGGTLPELMKRMKFFYPDVNIRLYDGTQEEIIHLVNTDEIDIVFVDTYALRSNEHLDYKHIFQDKICVFMSNQHPYSQKDFVSIEELCTQDLLVAGRILPATNSPSTSNSIISEVMSDHGLLPRIKHVARTISNMLLMVDCNVGMAIMPEKFSVFIPQAVECRPIILDAKDTNSTMDISVVTAWKSKNQNPCLSSVLSIIDGIVSEDN